MSEWREFPSAPCLAEKKRNYWQFTSRCCWNRARPWHASELVSFLVGLRTYQHPGTVALRESCYGQGQNKNRSAAFSWRCVSTVLGFGDVGWTRNYLSSAHELKNDCIFVPSCNQNAITVNMCLEAGLFMGHVDTCYLAGDEDGYEHRTGLCTVSRSKRNCATLRSSSLTSGTT